MQCKDCGKSGDNIGIFSKVLKEYLCYKCLLAKTKNLPPTKFKTDLNPIIKYLENKEICLVGNASSILNTEKDIDKYEIVCRCNKGYPKGKEKYIGNRTDILFLSTKVKNIEIEFTPKYTIWMTINARLASNYVKEHAFQNPFSDWIELQSNYSNNIRPTTGCMSLFFLVKYINFKSLTIIGFDFFETKSWYNTGFCTKNHDKELEKKIISNLVNENDKIKIKGE